LLKKRIIISKKRKEKEKDNLPFMLTKQFCSMGSNFLVETVYRKFNSYGSDIAVDIKQLGALVVMELILRA
jgi:hypothetical protein